MITKFRVLILLILTLHRGSSVSEQKDGRNPLITGGYRETRNETNAAHIVSIRSHRQWNAHICSGSIISVRKILTAAHCFTLTHSARNFRDFEIVAGTIYRLTKSPNARHYNISKIIIHPEHRLSPATADIAILFLNRNIDINPNSIKILPLTQGLPRVGDKCQTLGWGRVIQNGPMPDEVLFVNLYIWDRRECKRIDISVNECVLCAGDVADNAKGTCGGDSGSPLICNGRQTGIVSYGIGCGFTDRAADFYTDVSCYLSWIENPTGAGITNFDHMSKISVCIHIFVRYCIFHFEN